jgi:hypothetical protein
MKNKLVHMIAVSILEARRDMEELAKPKQNL